MLWAFAKQHVSALSSFGVPGRQRDHTEEVFGSIDKDGIYQAGLLDAESLEKFDATLQSLKQKWVERGDTSQEGYSWVSERGALLKKEQSPVSVEMQDSSQ